MLSDGDIVIHMYLEYCMKNIWFRCVWMQLQRKGGQWSTRTGTLSLLSLSVLSVSLSLSHVHGMRIVKCTRISNIYTTLDYEYKKQGTILCCVLYLYICNKIWKKIIKTTWRKSVFSSYRSCIYNAYKCLTGYRRLTRYQTIAAS